MIAEAPNSARTEAVLYLIQPNTCTFFLDKKGVHKEYGSIPFAPPSSITMDEKAIISSEKAGRDSSLSQTSLDPTPPSTIVEFEDYLYYAAVQRRAEDLAMLPTGSEIEVKTSWFNRLSEHKGPNVNINVHEVDNVIPPTADELERENASRALRLASWSSVFYLITTDILGPFNAPFAISQTGWVPGTAFSLIKSIY